jgi:hypothetical protein
MLIDSRGRARRMHERQRHRMRRHARAPSPVMDDHRPTGSGFRGTCRTTREGGGLPEGPGIPAGITHDLVLLIDLPARRMEREERLLAMHGGDVNATLGDRMRASCSCMGQMQTTSRWVDGTCFGVRHPSATWLW